MKGEVLQQGRVEEVIWESPSEIVLASLEHGQRRTVAEPACRDTATELVVGQVKHRQGLRADAEGPRDWPGKAVGARVEHGQIPRLLPHGGWELSCELVARDVQQLHWQWQFRRGGGGVGGVEL